MKIAITGKGGVGKTTLAALLAKSFAERGYRVYAIDADPDANLASLLGVPDAESIRPIVEMKELIKERVGATSEEIGSYFSMNPRVDDIPEEYGFRLGNIRLLVMGHIPKARGGCACPENILVRELVSHALTQDREIVIMDMEAGIEHLGRGTAQGVDAMLIVVEPSKQSLATAKRIQKLAVDLGITKVKAVLNKLQDTSERASIKASLGDLRIAAEVPFDAELREASLKAGEIQMTEALRGPLEDH
jgi:CO dehydrogenase maturation factor